MNKQTAVEWLISVLAHNDILDHKALSSNERLYNLYKRLKEQAKEMEKQQIVDSFDCDGEPKIGEVWISNGEQYYNETYK